MQHILMYTVIFGTLLLAGCSGIVAHEQSTPVLGASVREIVVNQTLDPEAGGDAPVVGLDGRYAHAVAKKYHEGPKTDPKDGQSVSEVIIEAK